MSILSLARADWERFSQSAFDLDIVFRESYETGAETGYSQITLPDGADITTRDGDTLIFIKSATTWVLIGGIYKKTSAWTAIPLGTNIGNSDSSFFDLECQRNEETNDDVSGCVCWSKYGDGCYTMG